MNDIAQEPNCGCSSPLTSPESFHIHISASLDRMGLSKDILWVLAKRRSFSGRGVTRIM